MELIWHQQQAQSKLAFCEMFWIALRQFVIELISMQVSQVGTINLSGRVWQINKNETCLLIPVTCHRFNYIDVIPEFMRSAWATLYGSGSVFERVQRPADIDLVEWGIGVPWDLGPRVVSTLRLSFPWFIWFIAIAFYIACCSAFFNSDSDSYSDSSSTWASFFFFSFSILCAPLEIAALKFNSYSSREMLNTWDTFVLVLFAFKFRRHSTVSNFLKAFLTPSPPFH